MGNFSQFPENGQTNKQPEDKKALLIQLKVAINNLIIAMEEMNEHLPEKEDDEGVPFTHRNEDIIEKLKEVEKKLEKFIEDSTFDKRYLSWLEDYLIFRVEEFFGKIRYYVNPPTGCVQNALFYLRKIMPSELYIPDEKKFEEEISKLSPEVREEILKLKSVIEYVRASLDKIKLYVPRHSGLKLLSTCDSLIDDLNFVLKYIEEIPSNYDMALYAKTSFEKILLFLDSLREYYKSDKMIAWIDKISRTSKFGLVIINKCTKQMKK